MDISRSAAFEALDLSWKFPLNTDAYRVDSERDLRLLIFKPGSVYVYCLYTPINYYFKCVMLPVVKM